MTDGSDRAAELAEQLVRSLLALEPAVRSPAARRMLERLPAERAVAVLQELIRRRDSGEARALEALSSVTEGLFELADGDIASALYASALEHNADDVARLLMRPAPAKAFDPRQEHGVDREMRSLTVGFRRQMARSANPVVLMRLQTDPDPGVIRNLLLHPRLTEPEVVRMAARRPGRPEVLSEIYRSRRWAVRREVRRALANNPYTPTEIALKIIPLLQLPDLRDIAQDGGLHPQVRSAAKARLVVARHRRDVAHAAAHLADLDPEGDA